jgi:hypothetical protein
MKTDREVALKSEVKTTLKIAQHLLIEARCVGLSAWYSEENQRKIDRIIEDLETIRRELLK